jgi:chromosome segregation ATPase
MTRIYTRHTGRVDERLVDLARELEARDERLAAAIAEVDELQRSTERIRGRAGELAELLARLPAERAAAAGAVEEAARELEARERTLADAEAEVARLEGSRHEERLAEARRVRVRAADAASAARRKLERAEEARGELEREAAAAEREAPEVERDARRLADRLARVPRVSHGATDAPEHGLDATIEWGGRARAALFVVRGGLDLERERVVREANELAASALGEPASALSVSVVRARLERA